MTYAEKINEAHEIQKKYLALGPDVCKKIGVCSSKYSPNRSMVAVAKSSIYAGSKLAGQIMTALELGHLQLAIVGLRTLFEMAANSCYIFNHPGKGQNKRHSRKVCKELVRLSYKRRNVNHTRIDGKSFRQRLIEVNMGHLYNKNYRTMSDWAHLMTQTIFLKDEQLAQKFGADVAANTLHSLHNIFDSVCACYTFALNSQLEELVREYKPEVT